jgi:hypothetical protein
MLVIRRRFGLEHFRSKADRRGRKFDLVIEFLVAEFGCPTFCATLGISGDAPSIAQRFTL